jgi:hypothetical protein
MPNPAEALRDERRTDEMTFIVDETLSGVSAYPLLAHIEKSREAADALKEEFMRRHYGFGQW